MHFKIKTSAVIENNNVSTNQEDHEDHAPQTNTFYVSKPDTWHHAGWLPMIVATMVVGAAFTLGIMHNNAQLKDKRAAEQAIIDANKGIVRTDSAGLTILKLIGEKTVTGFDGDIEMAIKSVKGSASSLEVTLNILNKFKSNIQNLAITLIDIAQNGKEIKAVENTQALGDIPTDSLNTNSLTHEKKVHFNLPIGESKQFLVYCKFTTAGSTLEKSIAAPFQIK